MQETQPQPSFEPNVEMESIRKKAVALFEPSGEKPELSDRLYKMIDYAIKRFDWYEDQRYRLLQVGLALLALSGTLTLPAAKFTTEHHLAGAFALAAVFVAFITALSTFLVFQLNLGADYPHRGVADIRSWYFKYNLPNRMLPSLNLTEAERQDRIKDVVKDFEKFVKRWSEYIAVNGRFMAEDLEQVFILQLLQSYSSKNRDRLIHILLSGAIFSSFFVLMSAVSYAAGG